MRAVARRSDEPTEVQRNRVRGRPRLRWGPTLIQALMPSLNRADSFLTAFSLILYTTSTYVEDVALYPHLNILVWVLEVVTTSGLLYIYLRRLCASVAPFAEALSPGMLLDLITSGPVLWDLLFNGRQHTWVRVLRVLRVLRTHTRAAELSMQPVDRQAVVIGLTLFSVIYISSCLFPLLEYGDEDSPHEHFPLHDALYFVIITITTVGYGDITPHTTRGRLVSLCMVACTFVLLPLQTSKFIELYARADRFSAAFRPDSDHPHVVIFGTASAPTLVMIREQLLASGDATRGRAAYHAHALRIASRTVAALRRLRTWVLERLMTCSGTVAELATRAAHYTTDADTASSAACNAEAAASSTPQATVLLVVSPGPPDALVRTLLLEQPDPKWLHWIVGSALSPVDLERAGAEHAAAAIVLSADEGGGGVGGGEDDSAIDAPDTRALLDALSLRYRVPATRTIVQLARHAHARQLRALGVHTVLEGAMLTDFLLGLSGHCRGVSTLLLQLLRPPPHCSNRTASSISDGCNGDDRPRDSGQRLQQELVPTALVGRTPYEAVILAYEVAGAVLIARCTPPTPPPPAAGGGHRGQQASPPSSSRFTKALAPMLLRGDTRRLQAGEQLLYIGREGGMHILNANADGSAQARDTSQRAHSNGSHSGSGGRGARGYARLGEDDASDVNVNGDGTLPFRTVTWSAAGSDERDALHAPSAISSSTGQPSAAATSQLTAAEGAASREATLGLMRAHLKRSSSTDVHLFAASHGAVFKRDQLLHTHVPSAGADSTSGGEADKQNDDENGADDDKPARTSESNADTEGPPSPPPDVCNHFILCGLPPHPGGLRDFVSPLRARARFREARDCPPVVLLAPRPPDYAVWARACHLGAIYYIRGSYTDMEDLLSAGIDRASAVVIPATHGVVPSGGPASLDSTPLYQDAAPLLACREIESMPAIIRPSIVVCELRHAPNLDFFRPAPPLGAPRLRRFTPPSPLLARGGDSPPLARFGSSPHRSQADDSAAVGEASSSIIDEELSSPHVRGGCVLSGSLMRAALCRLLSVPLLPELLQNLLLGGPSGGCLLLVDVPLDLVGEGEAGIYHSSTYAQLVHRLAEGADGAVPLGLLRCALHATGANQSGGEPGWYVVAAPSPTTILRSDDRVYVLGTLPGVDADGEASVSPRSPS